MERGREEDRASNGVERALIELLHNGGPRTLDDIENLLPGNCFAQVFLAIDRMSREGLVRVLPGDRGYRVVLAN